MSSTAGKSRRALFDERGSAFVEIVGGHAVRDRDAFHLQLGFERIAKRSVDQPLGVRVGAARPRGEARREFPGLFVQCRRRCGLVDQPQPQRFGRLELLLRRLAPFS